MFQPGDRVRWETQGEDGFPVVKYGFVGGSNGDRSRVVVMLDDDLKGDTVVDVAQLEPVTITNLELRLHGIDLVTDPSLRCGLVHLWTAEADQAGLEIREVVPIDGADPVSRETSCALAHVRAVGQEWELRADYDALIDDAVRIRLVPIGGA